MQTLKEHVFYWMQSTEITYFLIMQTVHGTYGKVSS